MPQEPLYSEAPIMKVKIRGIYSTALTKILTENNYEIVQPTTEVASRLGLLVKEDIPNMEIWDRSDLQGIIAIGEQSALEDLKNVLRKRIGTVITRTPKVTKNSIYKAKILGRDYENGPIKVDLGDTIAILKEPYDKNSDTILVQVKEHDYGRHLPIVSTQITIPSDVAVLLPEPVVRISTKIRDPKRRKELFLLGHKIRENNKGILWRTSAAKIENDELIYRIHELMDKAEEILKSYETAPVPYRIFEGTGNADIEFPYDSKIALDKIRRQLIPTIDRHHFLKSAGFGDLVTLSEEILKDGIIEHDYLNRKINQILKNKLPKLGDIISVEHVKLDGRTIILTKGRIIERTDSKYIIKKVFWSGHRTGSFGHSRYDGIRIRREEGDFAITEIVEGSKFLKTQYFSKNGKMKGIYVNINTPIEIYPDHIRYIDLEIDVVARYGDKPRIIDQQLLTRALERGYITEEIAEEAKNIALEKYNELLKEKYISNN